MTDSLFGNIPGVGDYVTIGEYAGRIKKFSKDGGTVYLETKSPVGEVVTRDFPAELLEVKPQEAESPEPAEVDEPKDEPKPAAEASATDAQEMAPVEAPVKSADDYQDEIEHLKRENDDLRDELDAERSGHIVTARELVDATVKQEEIEKLKQALEEAQAELLLFKQQEKSPVVITRAEDPVIDQFNAGAPKVEVKTLIQDLAGGSADEDLDLEDALNDGWVIIDCSVVATHVNDEMNPRITRVVTLERWIDEDDDGKKSPAPAPKTDAIEIPSVNYALMTVDEVVRSMQAKDADIWDEPEPEDEEIDRLIPVTAGDADAVREFGRSWANMLGGVS